MGKKKKKSSRGYGAVGGFGGVNRGTAASIVNNQIRQEVEKIRRQRNYASQDIMNDIEKSNQLYDRSRGDLDYVRGEVLDAISGNNAAIDAAYGGAIDRNRASTADLIQSQQAQTAAARAALGDELARLGIQGGADHSRFEADAVNSTQMANQSGANNIANMELARGMAGSVGGMLGSMAQGSYQSHLGRALNDRNDAIEAAQDSRRRLNEQFEMNRMDIRRGRPGMINELLESMTGSAFDRWMGIQQLNAQRRSALGGGGGGGYSSGGSAPAGSGFANEKVVRNPQQYVPRTLDGDGWLRMKRYGSRSMI